MSAAPMLSLEDVTVQFGGLVANDAVSLQVETNSIAALIGPNGAGKTTLFNVVTGALAPSHGTIVYRGRDITRSSRMQRGRLGIARTFQHIALVDELKQRGFKVVHMVPKAAATTLPDYDAQARKLLANKLAAAKEPLASRAVTWPQSDGESGREVLPWSTHSTGVEPSTAKATNQTATVPWYKQWFMP